MTRGNADDRNTVPSGLGTEKKPKPKNGWPLATTVVARPAPGPPTDTYKGRRQFHDLFIEDGPPISHSPAGGPEEKVAYFREKLRRLEVKVARFRAAWATRDTEVDKLERIVARERKASNENRRRAQALGAFVARMKAEMQAYSKRVATAFSEKDTIERRLREEIDRIRASADRERDELRQTLDSFDQDLAERNESIRALKATIELQKDTVQARTRELIQARNHAEESRTELLEGLRSLNKEVAARDEEINALRASGRESRMSTQVLDGQVAEASEAIAARDAKLARYERALRNTKNEVYRLQFEVGSLRRELQESRTKRRSTGIGEGWEAVDAFAEVLEMSALAERVARRLEMVVRKTLQGPKIYRSDVRDIAKLAGRLRDCLDRVHSAASRG